MFGAQTFYFAKNMLLWKQINFILPKKGFYEKQYFILSKKRFYEKPELGLTWYMKKNFIPIADPHWPSSDKWGSANGGLLILVGSP